jgi:sugar lactone lactonase YvrE
MWAQVITTVAGTDWTFPTSRLLAVNAPLGNVQGIAVDARGNIYVADAGNNMVMQVAANGTLTVVAGNGIVGCSGDGGPATSAAITHPIGVAVDAAGNFYISDGCNLVRKVTPNGKITTVAGTGNLGFFGDDGPATSVVLNIPMGMAVDAGGNLYIADRDNNRVRKVTPGGMITTVAGHGDRVFFGDGRGFSGDGGLAMNATLSGPTDVALDADGNLYIADAANNRIRKVAPNGTITTVAGNGSQNFSGDGGPATRAGLNNPTGVNVDAFGNLWIVDSGNNRVRKLILNGPIVTVAGSGVQGFSGDGGSATSAALFSPSFVVGDAAGNLYLSDYFNNRIRKVTPGGTISTLAGNGLFRFSGDGGPATSAVLNGARGAAIDAAGNLYISDYKTNRIRKITSSGTITTIAGTGVAGFLGDGGPGASAALNFPWGLAVDNGGNIYIGDSGNNRIRKVTAAGTITTVSGNGVLGFSGDGGPATKASLANPTGVALDTPQVICTLQMLETTAFVRWRLTVRSLRLPETAHKAIVIASLPTWRLLCPCMEEPRRARRSFPRTA